jgi:hypothetical protein
VATEIKIKRSGVAVSPSSLGAGELAYSWEGTTGGKLFIGWGNENGDGEAANISPIGGKYYTDLLSVDSGVATASKAVILGNNKKIDEWSVDNITIDGNTISTTSGILNLSPEGTNTVTVPAGYKDRTGFGTNSLVTKEYVDGTTSDASKITLVDDAADSDEYITGNNLTFAGGTGLTSAVTNDTVTFDLDATTVTAASYGSATQIPTFTVDAQGRLTAAGNQSISTTLAIATKDLATGTGGDSSGTVALGVDTLAFLGDSAEGIQVTFNDVSKEITINATSATTGKKGVASFNSADFDVTSGDVTIKDGGVSNDQLAGSIANDKLAGSIANDKLAFDSVTIGTTSIALGGSSTTLAGLTQIDVDNVRIDGNTISTTDAGESTLFLNPGPVGDSGEVVILGDLTVQGTTTTINSTEVTINDLVLTLADSADDGTAANGAGIIIGSSSFSSPPSLTYDGSNDRWVFNKTVEATIHDLSETIDDRVNTLFTDGQSIGSVYDDNANTLTVNVDIATTSALGVARFDGIAESDGGSTNQFTLTSGGVRLTAIDGGTY